VIRRLAAAAIVAICVGAPIVEMFDQWDHTLQDGNDTEANVALVALTVGLAIVVSGIVLVARIRGSSLMRASGSVRTPRFISLATISFVSPIPTISPPTPLRV
jgi:hypothetical protein